MAIRDAKMTNAFTAVGEMSPLFVDDPDMRAAPTSARPQPPANGVGKHHLSIA